MWRRCGRNGACFASSCGERDRRAVCSGVRVAPRHRGERSRPIAAECQAACGVGPAAQPIASEPGWWVVRGKLDAVDEPAPDDLPNSGVGILAGNAAYSLFCELDGAGDLYGRQVWTRAKRVSAADPPAGQTIAMRDCQGLSIVDELR